MVLSPIVIAAICVGILFLSAILFQQRPTMQTAQYLNRAVASMTDRRYAESLALFQEADDRRQKMRPGRKNRTFEFGIENGRGNSLLSLGDHSNSRKHLIRATELIDADIEPRTPSTRVYLYANLAAACVGCGDGDGSETAMEKLQSICDKVQANNATDVAETLSIAAAGAASKLQTDLAVKLSEFAIKILDDNDWQYDGTLAYVQTNLSSYYVLAGRYTEARALLETALENATANMDQATQCRVLVQHGHLAILEGQCEDSITALSEAFEISKILHGTDHWRATIVEASLANTYSIYGDYEKALYHYEHAQQIYDEQLPTDDSVRVSNSLMHAKTLLDLGRFDKCDELLSVVEELPQQRLEGQSNSLLALHLIRGMSELKQFRPLAAVRSLEKSLSEGRRLYDDGHKLLADVLVVLGSAYTAAKMYEKVEGVLTDATRTQRNHPDKNVLGTADLLINLAELNLSMGDTQQAKFDCDMALQIVGDCVLPHQFAAVKAKRLRADVELALGNPETAMTMLQEVEDCLTKVVTEQHPTFYWLNQSQAAAFRSLGRDSDALIHEEKAKAVRAIYSESQE